MGLPQHARLVAARHPPQLDSLFDLDQPVAFDRDRLRDRLAALAARGVRVGASSWKYEGWLGQIYSRSRYQVRGRFSKKLFEETCIAEYATIFPTVCGDFAFYQFPTEAFWAKLFAQTPPGFRWAFKVPEQITVPCWPRQPRYGALAGLANPTFLDPDLFELSFLQPLERYRDRIGALIFEFGTMRERTLPARDEASQNPAAAFIRTLEPFLARLPAGWRYAVEIRNVEFLRPEYFACLRRFNVAHVYSAWTRMPEITEQIAIPESRTSDLLVARALLRRGRTYEDAVKMFAPYNRVQEVNETVRRALRDLIDIALVDGQPAFVFVNNRLEGNSPATIVAITE